MKLEENWSLIIFFLLFGALMLWDLIAILKGGYKATVSAQLYKFSLRFPIIPFILGIVFGHLFWANLGACFP